MFRKYSTQEISLNPFLLIQNTKTSFKIQDLVKQLFDNYKIYIRVSYFRAIYKIDGLNL